MNTTRNPLFSLFFINYDLNRVRTWVVVTDFFNVTTVTYLSAIGNNINQILFYVNTNGILNVPDLNVELKKLREVEKFIREHYEAKRY